MYALKAIFLVLMIRDQRFINNRWWECANRGLDRIGLSIHR
jgi:hypothetical protein